jgi:molecular chaperone GrpE
MNDEKKTDLKEQEAQTAAEEPVAEEETGKEPEAEAAAREEKAEDTAAKEGAEKGADGKGGKEGKKEKHRFRKTSADEEKIEKLEKENAELNDRYLRVCAEYDNFRRRSQKEREALYADIKADTITKFLPVYDNLERALKQGTEDEAYRKGVEMIMNQFNATMEKLGVTEIDCLGQKFDPTLHNAVMHVDDPEKGENEIVDVFQKGFMIGDKVVRFAMVKVAN